MEQIAVSFTDGWVPKTWLTPKITIIGRDGTVYVNNGTCKELSNGWYIYNFAKYNPTKVYLYVFDWGSALSNSYDRYKFWGNEFDAYSNKYSWGRTAAPYFTSINGRFDKVDEAFKIAEKNRYDDWEVRKAIREVKKELKSVDVYEKLWELQELINTVNTSVKNESSSKISSDINEKLDLMAEYVVRMKEDVDNELNSVSENITNSITEWNNSINEWMSSKVNIDQLLQQVERLENKMNVVLDAFVKTQMEWMLPKDITDRYDVNLSRREMSDEDMARALWLNEGISEWIGEARPEQLNAPVDMQWIAEPEMPLTY